MFCKKCGAELKENAKFCIKCGWKIDTETKMIESNEVKDKEQKPVNHKETAVNMKCDTNNTTAQKRNLSKRATIIISGSVVAAVVAVTLIVGIIRRGSTKSIMSAYESFYQKYCDEHYVEQSLEYETSDDENFAESADCAGKVVMEGKRPLLVIADMTSCEYPEGEFDFHVYEFNGFFVKERTVIEDVKGSDSGVFVFCHEGYVYIYSEADADDAVYKITEKSYEKVKNIMDTSRLVESATQSSGNRTTNVGAYVNSLNTYCNLNMLYRIYVGMDGEVQGLVGDDFVGLLSKLATADISDEFELACMSAEYMMDENYYGNYRIIHWEDGLCYSYSTEQMRKISVNHGLDYDEGTAKAEYETDSADETDEYEEEIKNLLQEPGGAATSTYSYSVDNNECADRVEAASALNQFYEESDYTLVKFDFDNVYTCYDTYCMSVGYDMPDVDVSEKRFLVIDYDPQYTEFIVKDKISDIPVTGVRMSIYDTDEQLYLQIPESSYDFAVNAENLILCCPAGSYAEQYAKAEGVSYLNGTIEEDREKEPVDSGIRIFKNKVFEKYIEELGPDFEYDITRFALVDVNGDDIPELFSSGIDEWIRMFYIDDKGDVQTLEANAGNYLYNIEKNILITKVFHLDAESSYESTFYQYDTKKKSYTEIHNVTVQEERIVWKESYLSKIDELEDYYSYRLEDINGDNIPELFGDSGLGGIEMFYMDAEDNLQMLSINMTTDFSISPKGELVDRGNASMSVGQLMPWRIYVKESTTGIYMLAYELKFDLKSDAYDRISDEISRNGLEGARADASLYTYTFTDVMDDETSTCASYDKAVQLFNSSYDASNDTLIETITEGSGPSKSYYDYGEIVEQIEQY